MIKKTGNIKIGEAAGIEEIVWPATELRVAESGGDFTTIKDAIDSINDNSVNKRYVVLVAPGIYSEDNPIQGKSYVSLRATGDLQTTRIVAANGSADLFTMASFFSIEGFTFWGVTGASNYAINQSVAGITSIDRCAFAECSNGILLNHASGVSTLNNCGTYNLTVTSVRGVYVQAGNLTINDFTASLGNITTLINVTGVNSIATLNNVLSFNPNVVTCIFVQDLARVVCNMSSMVGMTDGIVVEGGSNFKANSLSIFNATQDGFRINDVGSNTIATVNGAIEDSTRYNFNLLSATAIVTGLGSTGVDKLNFVAGVSMIGAIIDDKEDDEGFNVIGELHVGLPEIGKETVLGEGDSYTRGMLVYTETDTNVFADVSTAAKSASGSTFTFTDVTADSSIYIASSLLGADVLEHYGIKTKVNTACVVGSGEIVIEYWNGSAWIEVNGMEVQSSGKYFPYAKNYFQQTGGHHIRYNNTLITDSWTKNDPMSLGTDYYWIRFRIKTAITTAPIFEQFKLHTNRFETNSDGWIEYFGKARPIGQLPLSLALGKPFEGNMQSQTLYVSQDIGIGGTNNKFTSTTDKMGLSGILPFDCDTSCPLKVMWGGHPNATGTYNWTVRWAWVTVGDPITYAEPGSPIANSGSITVSRSATADQLAVFDVDIDVSELVSRVDAGYGNSLWISIHPTTLAGNFSLGGSQITYTKWCEGGHI